MKKPISVLLCAVLFVSIITLAMPVTSSAAGALTEDAARTLIVDAYRIFSAFHYEQPCVTFKDSFGIVEYFTLYEKYHNTNLIEADENNYRQLDESKLPGGSYDASVTRANAIYTSAMLGSVFGNIQHVLPAAGYGEPLIYSDTDGTHFINYRDRVYAQLHYTNPYYYDSKGAVYADSNALVKDNTDADSLNILSFTADGNSAKATLVISTPADCKVRQNYADWLTVECDFTCGSDGIWRISGGSFTAALFAPEEFSQVEYNRTGNTAARLTATEARRIINNAFEFYYGLHHNDAGCLKFDSATLQPVYLNVYDPAAVVAGSASVSDYMMIDESKLPGGSLANFSDAVEKTFTATYANALLNTLCVSGTDDNVPLTYKSSDGSLFINASTYTQYGSPVFPRTVGADGLPELMSTRPKDTLNCNYSINSISVISFRQNGNAATAVIVIGYRVNPDDVRYFTADCKFTYGDDGYWRISGGDFADCLLEVNEYSLTPYNGNPATGDTLPAAAGVWFAAAMLSLAIPASLAVIGKKRRTR